VEHDRGGYEKTEYMEGENIEDDMWITGITRKWRIINNQELRELYTYLDTAADVRRKRSELGRTSRKNR
jgi:hypothetical protein